MTEKNDRMNVWEFLDDNAPGIMFLTIALTLILFGGCGSNHDRLGCNVHVQSTTQPDKD